MFKAFSRPWSSISRQKCRIWMRICRVMQLFVIFLKVANTFFMIWGSFSLIFKPGKGSFDAKLSSRDQVGCLRSLPEDQNPAGASGRRLGWRTMETARLPWILVFGEAALAAESLVAKLVHSWCRVDSLSLILSAQTQCPCFSMSNTSCLDPVE